MKNIELKCFVAELFGEVLIGTSIGIVAKNDVFPKCRNTGEKVVTLGGMYALTWLLGRKFAREFYEFCDMRFDTDLRNILFL